MTKKLLSSFITNGPQQKEFFHCWKKKSGFLNKKNTERSELISLLILQLLFFMKSVWGIEMHHNLKAKSEDMVESSEWFDIICHFNKRHYHSYSCSSLLKSFCVLLLEQDKPHGHQLYCYNKHTPGGYAY